MVETPKPLIHGTSMRPFELVEPAEPAEAAVDTAAVEVAGDAGNAGGALALAGARSSINGR